MNMFAGLDTEAYDRKYSDRQLLLRIGRFLGVYRLKITASFAALMLMAVASTAFPLLVAAALDRLPVPQLLLAQLAAASLTIGVLMWGLNYWRARWFSELIGDVVLALRSEAFRAAADHDLSFYDEFRSGRVISRITSDTQEAADALQQLTVAVFAVVSFGVEAGEHVHCSLYALKRRRTHNGQRCCGNPAIRAAGLRAARPQQCARGATPQLRLPSEFATGGA